MSISTSTCILCYKNFDSVQCTTSEEVNEHQACFENFFKFLLVPEEERSNYQHLDFGNELPFCKKCYRLPKELSTQCTAKEKLEEEVLKLQERLCEKIRELSVSIEAVGVIFGRVKEQVDLSENAKTRVRERRKERLGLGEQGDEDAPLSVNLDDKFERLRRLVLEWTPEKCAVTAGLPSEIQKTNKKLIQAYPSNFMAPLNEDMICNLEPTDFEFEEGCSVEAISLDENDVQEVDEFNLPITVARNNVGLLSPDSQDDDQNDCDSIQGTMGDESACDDFSENSSSATHKNKGDERSRKRKRKTSGNQKDGLSNLNGERLDPPLGSTEDSCGSEESDDNKIKKFKSGNEEPLDVKDEQDAMSYKYSKVLGKFEIVEEKTIFKGIEVKKVDGANGSGFECGACGILKLCDFTDVLSVRIMGLLLRKHIQIEHLGGYKCEWCPEIPEQFACTSLYSLLIHMRSEHKIPEYECNICGRPFIQRKEFVDHQQWSHMNDEEKAEAMKKQKEQAALDDNMYQCNLCKNIFSNANDLKRHAKLHLDEREKPRMPCQFCGNLYDPTSLQQHVKLVHRKSQVHWFPCEFCDLKFYSETVLERHIRRIHSLDTETNSKPYSCQFCHQNFATRDDLDSHKEECHTEITELPDDDIAYGSRRRRSSSAKKDHRSSDSQKHTSVEEPPKRSRGRPPSNTNAFHQCTICPSSFTRKDRLTRHLNTVHADRTKTAVTFDCPLCDSSFTINDRLVRHMKMVHSVANNMARPVQSTSTSKSSVDENESENDQNISDSDTSNLDIMIIPDIIPP